MSTGEVANVSAGISGQSKAARRKKIAAECATSIRRAAIGSGITQIGDLVSGATFGALLVEKNLKSAVPDASGEPDSFRSAFDKACREDLPAILSGDAEGVVDNLSKHRMSAVGDAPDDATMIVGLMFEAAMSEASPRLSLSRGECLSVMAYVTCLSMAAAADKSDVQGAVDYITSEIIEKIEAWDMIFPNDEEMFGEDIAADLQDDRRSVK